MPVVPSGNLVARVARVARVAGTQGVVFFDRLPIKVGKAADFEATNCSQSVCWSSIASSPRPRRRYVILFRNKLEASGEPFEARCVGNM